MAAGESVETTLARMDGRLEGIEKSIGKTATTERVDGLRDSVKDLRDALANEVTARTAADAERKLEWQTALAAEKVEREKVAARLQEVEDKQETRRYQFGISIALGALAIVFGLVQAFLGQKIGI